MTLALLPNPLLSHFSICGRRKCMSFSIVHKLPQILWLKQHTFLISVSAGQKSGPGFIGASALARVAVSSQDLTKEGFTLKLSWLLTGHGSFQLVRLRASLSNWHLASGTIISLPYGLLSMAAYFIKAGKRESSKIVT